MQNVIVAYVVIVITTTMCVVLTIDDWVDSDFSEPVFVIKFLYDATEMNIFGCFLSAALFYVFCPIVMFLRLAIIVIWFITHVGRKE